MNHWSLDNNEAGTITFMKKSREQYVKYAKALQESFRVNIAQECE